MTVQEKVEAGRAFFRSGKTLDYAYRMRSLEALERVLVASKDEIFDALHSDLNKTPYEGFMTEYAMVMAELSLAKKKLKHWMKPIKKLPSLGQMPVRARVYSQPYGLVLIISPWNYPFQLGMIPLISAIAAGNAVLLKPSNYSAYTADVLETIVTAAFEPNHVQVVKGGREENQELLDERYDYLFFTGSPAVGKLVMEKASRHLTPVTLELGGKSPCIVAEDANVKATAKRIVFGKLLNAGKTCVAPDYVLVHENIADKLIAEFVKEEQRMLPSDEYVAEHVPKIINAKHRMRIVGILKELSKEQVVYQSGVGRFERGQVPFTIVKNPAEDSLVMTEELFAPILPVVTYREMEEALRFVSSRPKPLALYLFTQNKALKKKVLKELSFGGGCVNDTVIHIASHYLPFGGVGASGMGRYHGKYGFDTFSSKKSVIEKWISFDMPMRYHPYKKSNKELPLFLFKK